MESSSNKRPVSTTRPVFLTRPTSPNKNPTRKQSLQNKKPISSNHKKTKSYCTCSPTTHPGSFRCSLHKNNNNNNNNNNYNSSRLNARRSAMTNSLVRRIGTVEVDFVRRALTALIRPSSHQQRRRGDFTARPSRLRFMSMAD